MQDWTMRSFVTGEAPFIGFDNYARVFSDPAFTRVAWQTTVFTVVSLLVQYVIGLALAIFFSRRFPLSMLLRSLMLIPWLLPIVVSATTWRWMFHQDYGVINARLFDGTDIGWLSTPELSLWSVIIANIWLGIPFNLVMLYGGLQSIPDSVYEAAAIDGAGPWRIFTSITFPLLRPVSTVTLLLGLVYTLKAFDIIWVMSRGGPVNSSHTLSTWSYQFAFETERALGVGSAVATILFFIAVVFGFFYMWTLRREARQ
ncbi:MAG: ABC transporter permease [Actinobacteria bacterium HGW-Actinobacteria-4]|nr:MAG: ABC transporter permease [Actinobacteria bacterium HGW-Actinobacteria-4]